ncbi:MAG TPA: hypothetical protein VG435_14140 [Acidimicrobiales bacterium]|jgi:hypothetical protein|nr:hypothetical protein [Acidimicrobiales bacterium]
MERIDFIGSSENSWWLLAEDDELGAALAAQRLELGRALGWMEPTWYTDEERLGRLYDELLADSPDLLQAAPDLSRPDEQAAWFTDALVALTRDTDESPLGETETETGEPESEDAVGTSAAPAPATPAAAPAKKSIFKSKDESEASESEDPGEPTLEEATETVLADLTGATLAQLAEELGVDVAELEEIVQSSDFDDLVRAEAARLIAE